MGSKSNILLVSAICIFSFGCSNHRSSVTPPDELNSTETTVEAEDPLHSHGIIRDMRKTEGCGFMIEVTFENGEKQLLEPNSLDEKYQVDGKSIVFTYNPSRRSTTCTTPSQTVTIIEIFE